MSQLATWEVGRILACLDYRMGNRSDGTGSITGSTARHSYTAQSNRELKVIDTTVSKPQNPQHDPALHRPPPPYIVSISLPDSHRRALRDPKFLTPAAPDPNPRDPDPSRPLARSEPGVPIEDNAARGGCGFYLGGRGLDLDGLLDGLLADEVRHLLELPRHVHFVHVAGRPSAAAAASPVIAG